MASFLAKYLCFLNKGKTSNFFEALSSCFLWRKYPKNVSMNNIYINTCHHTSLHLVAWKISHLISWDKFNDAKQIRCGIVMWKLYESSCLIVTPRRDSRSFHVVPAFLHQNKINMIMKRYCFSDRNSEVQARLRQWVLLVCVIRGW